MRNFERYCKDYENIENYEAAKKDNFVGWCCHHRKGINISKKELKTLGMYYNRPAEELIFLTESEHSSLHSKGESHPMYGKHHSEESKKKMSDIKKGKHHTEETKNKLSELNSGEKNSFYGKHHTEETKKKMSNSWDYDKHFSIETRKKIGSAAKLNSTGRHWYNNGKINKFCFECPEGFTPGQLHK